MDVVCGCAEACGAPLCRPYRAWLFIRSPVPRADALGCPVPALRASGATHLAGELRVCEATHLAGELRACEAARLSTRSMRTSRAILFRPPRWAGELRACEAAGPYTLNTYRVRHELAQKRNSSGGPFSLEKVAKVFSRWSTRAYERMSARMSGQMSARMIGGAPKRRIIYIEGENFDLPIAELVLSKLQDFRAACGAKAESSFSPRSAPTRLPDWKGRSARNQSDAPA